MELGYQRGASAVGDVAEYIAATWLHRCLFAYTSHYALCIRQTTHQLQTVPVLRIEPLRASDQVEFRFLDTKKEAKQWSRIEPPERVIARFKRTLEQLHWVAKRDMEPLPAFGLQTGNQ